MVHMLALIILTTFSVSAERHTVAPAERTPSRDVVATNLMSEFCGDCDDVDGARPFPTCRDASCPYNAILFESFEAGGGSGDVISTVASGLGVPAVAMRWAASRAARGPVAAAGAPFWRTAIQNQMAIKAGAPGGAIDLSLLPFGPAPTVARHRRGGHRSSSFPPTATRDMERSSYTRAVLLQEIIEFEEMNADGMFTPGVDVVVRRYNLASDAVWRKARRVGVVDEALVDAASPVSRFRMRSSDGVVALTFDASTCGESERGEDADGTHAHEQPAHSPNATRVTIEINAFPYTSTTSLLALKLFTLSDSASSDAAVAHLRSTQLYDRITRRATGYYGWGTTGRATLGTERSVPRSVRVRVSNLIDVVDHSELDYGVGKALLATGGDDTAAAVAFVSFGAVHPASLEWSFAIGWGAPPAAPQLFSRWSAAVAIGCGLFLSFAPLLYSALVLHASRAKWAQLALHFA